VASQQQHSDDSPAAPHAGPLGEVRTTLPPPANDNRGRSVARVLLVLAAAAAALALGVMALHPFG
jgi:hypothetical protein